MVIQIGNEKEVGNVKSSMKRKGQYTRIAFCVMITHIKATWKNFLYITFKNIRALFYISWTIDENTDTVHLIKGFVF